MRREVVDDYTDDCHTTKGIHLCLRKGGMMTDVINGQ